MPTLRNYLQWYNITPAEACVLFNRKERTLWNWNNDPPPWVINILKLHITANPVPSSWKGWRFMNDLLLSPENQKYSQNDIRSTQYGKQLAEAISGSNGEIVTLKSHLEKQIALHQSKVTFELKKDNRLIKSINIDFDEING